MGNFCETEHLGEMFRAALTYFRTHGTFIGFFETPEANQEDKLSFRDFQTISTLGFNVTSSDLQSAKGLSNVAQTSLQKLFSIR